MLASIIVACYNHVDYISFCLRSVLEQTFRDIELILVDDDSTDGSLAVARTILSQPLYRSRFRRIVIEQNPCNLGASATWNRALSLARGDLIFLLNSDDYFDPARVDSFANDQQDRPLYFGFSYTQPVDEANQISTTSTAAEIKFRPRRVTRKLPAISWSLLDFNITITTGNFVFTRQLWNAVGGFDDLKYCHDWHFVLRAMTYVEPSLVEQQLYFYRLHTGNSFLQLAGLADQEASQCYRAYVEMALLRAPANRSCLSPHNQGPAFLTLAALMPSFRHWLLAHYRPYLAGHRTITPGRNTTGLPYS